MNLNKFRESLRKKGWYFCMQEAAKTLFPIRWIHRKEVMDLHYEWNAYRKLERKYMPIIDSHKPQNASEEPQSKIIWVCWLQGEEQAPELVKRCIASIRSHAADHEVRIVTNDNLAEYITIPEYITEALRKKRMQYAHYSDYLRIALLERYGGVWIDSTVLMTDDLPSYVTDSPFFMFQHSPYSPSPILGSNWFLAAHKGNYVAATMKMLLERYWKQERHLCHYYMFHMLLSMILRNTDEGRRILNEMPYVSNAEVHLLQKALFEPYNEKRLQDFKRRAFCQKLTYKFKPGTSTSDKNTFYSHIINSN